MPVDNKLVSSVHQRLVSGGIRPEAATPQQVLEAAKAVSGGARIPLQTVGDLHGAVVAYAKKLIDSGARASVSFGQSNAGGQSSVLGVRSAQMQSKAFDVSDLVGFDPLKGLPKRDAYSPKEYLQVAQSHKGYLESALAQVSRMKANNATQRNDLVGKRDQARAVLVASLLPEASDAAVQKLGKLILVPAFVGVNVNAKVSALEQQLTSQKATLTASLGGKAPEAVAADRSRLEGEASSAKSERTKLLANEDVSDLYKTGYGTAEYKGGMFSPTSWNDGAQEKKALQAFPQYASWKDLSAAITKLGARAETASAAAAALPSAAVVDKARVGLADIAGKLPNVGKAVLDEMWTQLASHLDNADPADLSQRLEKAPQAQDLARFLGLKNQVLAFDAVGDSQLGKIEGSIQKELSALTKEMATLRQSPPKGTVSRQQLEQRFSERANTVGRAISTADQRCNTISSYNSYNPGTTFWDYMLWSSILGHHDTNTVIVHDNFIGGGGGNFGGGGAGGAWDASNGGNGSNVGGGAAQGLGVYDGLQGLPLFDGGSAPAFQGGTNTDATDSTTAQSSTSDGFAAPDAFNAPQGGDPLAAPGFDAPASLDAPAGLSWDAGKSTGGSDDRSVSDDRASASDSSDTTDNSNNNNVDDVSSNAVDNSPSDNAPETRADGS